METEVPNLPEPDFKTNHSLKQPANTVDIERGAEAKSYSLTITREQQGECDV
jgi:hypothetical protein